MDLKISFNQLRAANITSDDPTSEMVRFQMIKIKYMGYSMRNLHPKIFFF